MSASPPVLKKTAGAAANADIASLLRARNTLLWIATREEQRVESGIKEAAAAAAFTTFSWDCGVGFTDATGKAPEWNTDEMRAPTEALRKVMEEPGSAGEGETNRRVYVMRDLHRWLADPMLVRLLRNAARDLETVGRENARAVVILAPVTEVPPELADQCTVIDYPLPDRQEIESLLRQTVANLPESIRESAVTPETFAECVDAAVGLSAHEAANCYARSAVTRKRIDPAIVAGEKKRIIAREKVLTWYDPDPRGVDAIGGLEVLKKWLADRHDGFSPEARAFGLPAPKGVMLVGIPGCGKSLTAKAVAAAWKMPLLRLDMGALRSKYVGDSEANIRKALKTAETVAPCVLWLDEIEKSLAGSQGTQGDGGVASDALGSLLSWMQERQAPVFVVATANDVSGLPPELLRKGRFDELFFVDVPTRAERAAILKASLGTRTLPNVELLRASAAMVQFTGAEIAATVPDALLIAYNEGRRPLTADDLIVASKTVVPILKSMGERLMDLRRWADGRARKASLPESSSADSTAPGTTGAGAGARQLDVG